MHYNLTLYGNPFGCTESSNNTSEKDEYLNEIIEYAQPDIFTVNELRDNNIWADRILNEVLNDEEELWNRANLTYQFTSSSILNGLFFRSDKFTLHDQDVVYQDVNGSYLLRPIDIYTLYVNHPDLALGDTTYVVFGVAHLAASDEDERAHQTEAFMQRIHEMGPMNYIFTGDLNMDDAFEEAFQNLISDQNPAFSFEDPINVSSYWNNNSSVSLYHTQSTRFSDTNGGCFAGGGLDDRFDITLISPSIEDGTMGVQYQAGSYQVMGQSGNDYNQELQTFNNSVVPDEISVALYEMSDHLPVITDYSVDLVIGLEEDVSGLSVAIHAEIDGWYLVGPAEEQYDLELIDLSGRVIWSETFFADVAFIPAPRSKGVYLVRVNGPRGATVLKLPLAP